MSSTDQSQQLGEIVANALDLKGDERHRYLDEACGDNQALRQEVDSLLAEEAALDEGFLSIPIIQQLGEVDTPPDNPLEHLPTENLGSRTAQRAAERRQMANTPQSPAASGALKPGSLLGQYKIMGVLGRGGMGVVYLAEQHEPVRRRVALKVFRTMPEGWRRRRLLAEAHALARLHHPNVAVLFEVGELDDGHPFVAMELVQGSSLVDWCTEHRLRIEDRIKLFQGVCAGVTHAHEKGLVHSDLKPLNIQVTEIDGKPVAKVIDFGIARSTSEPLPGDSQITHSEVYGSPAYMSPEAIYEPQSVDTRSDVYSLGIVLYQLLVGVLPLNRDGDPIQVMLHRYAKEDIPKASTRYLELEDGTRRDIARARWVTEASVTRSLRGDLDAIIAKAIARDREHRYHSPEALAQDLDRYLDRRPVTARPQDRIYVFRRFLRRRAVPVLLISLLILTLVGGLIARSLEAERALDQAVTAQAAQANAEELSAFLISLFENANPDQVEGGNLAGAPMTVLELVESAADRLSTDLEAQPIARASFLYTLGRIFTELRQLDRASQLMRESLDIRLVELEPNHPDTIDSISQLGVLRRLQGRNDEALDLLQQGVDLRQAIDPDSLVLAEAINNLANLYWQLGNLDEAERLHNEALAIRSRRRGPNSQDAAVSLNNLGVIERQRENWPEAQRLLSRALEIWENELGSEHVRNALALQNLVLVERRLGEWDRALAYQQRTLEIMSAAFGPDNPRTFAARQSLHRILERREDYDEALVVANELVQSVETTEGTDSLDLVQPIQARARTLEWLGRFDDARTDLERVAQILESADSPDRRDLLTALEGGLLVAEGRAGSALRDLQATIDRRRAARAETERPGILDGTLMHTLGTALAQLRRNDEAHTVLTAALDIRRSELSSSHRDLAETVRALGFLELAMGRTERGRELLNEAADVLVKNYPASHSRIRGIATTLAGLEPTSSDADTEGQVGEG